MATRMQQRKGTAAQWTAADPILNAGELGWESDTNKFKIGDGTNHWDDLTYFLDGTDTGFNSADYLLATSKGAISGVAALNADINVLTKTAIEFEGATADSYETFLVVTDPTQDNTITLPNASGTVALTTDIAAGAVTETGTQTLTNKTLTSPVISGLSISDSSIVFEGSTADLHETTITFANPTEDRTITFPNNSGTVAFTADISAATGGSVSETGTQTLTNKSVSLATNTITGTLAQFNTAVTDADLASLAGTETLTNKTLTSPVLGGTTITASGNLAVQPATYILEVKGGASTEGAIQLNCSANSHGQIVKSQPHAQGASNTLLLPGGTTIGNANAVLVSDIGTQTLTNKTLTSPTLTTPDIGVATGTSLTLSGDLTINGTTTNINSTNLVVEDKNIVLGDTATPTDTTADGGGITLKGTTDHTFNWVNATDAWTSSEHLDLASGKEYKINNTSLKDVTETLANKSISFGSNTITSTLAQLNTAISDADLASLAGTETLTNKTLSSAVLSGTLTAGGSVGTAGQVLTSTGSGVQYSTPAGGAAFSEFMLIGA